MAATKAIQQKQKALQQIQTRTLTVAAGVTIYEGTLVSINGSGEAIVGTTGSRIAGVAQSTATAGETVTCYFSGAWWFNITSPVATMIGVTAYATDNNTVQTSSNTAILGPIVDVSSTQALVWITTRA
jgi:hypothetical protein